MAEIVERDDEKWIVSPLLSLRFRDLGDRWTHEVLLGGPGSRTFAAAIETPIGHEDPARVVSPTFQEIVLRYGEESDPGRPVPQAMLLGQSGPHHFSAVFTVYDHAPDGPDQPGKVYVQVAVADRCRGEIEELAATYGIPSDVGFPMSARPGEARWIEPAAGMALDFRVHDRGTAAGMLALSEASPPWGLRAQARTRLIGTERTRMLHYGWHLGPHGSDPGQGEP